MAGEKNEDTSRREPQVNHNGLATCLADVIGMRLPVEVNSDKVLSSRYLDNRWRNVGSPRSQISARLTYSSTVSGYMRRYIMRQILWYTRIEALVWGSLWCRSILRRYLAGGSGAGCSLSGIVNSVLGEVEMVLALSQGGSETRNRTNLQYRHIRGMKVNGPPLGS